MTALSLKYPMFQGPAKRLEDMDLPRRANEIGVGEDEIHAFMEVETNGGGFDSTGRPKLLFEPHKFYANLKDPKQRAEAVKQGLAYKTWGEKPYPKDSYPRLIAAMKINAEAALKSASVGLGQIMGENFAMVGFDNVFAMYDAACEDEENQLEMIIQFLINAGIDDDMRRLAALTRPTTPADCVPIVRVYNGSGYAKNKYDVKFAAAHNRWRGIKDTPWSPEIDNGAITADVTAPVIVPPTVVEQDVMGKQMIMDLQQALKDKGYTEVGTVDGKIGKNTLSAIAAFQIAQGLPVDGKVTSGLYHQVIAAPMRPVSEERANATVTALVDQKVAGANEGVWLKRIGAAVTGTMGLGAVFDGGPVDLDHVVNSATKLHAIYVMFGNALPWLIGIGVGGAVLYFGHRLLTKQLEGFRKGTVR